MSDLLLTGPVEVPVPTLLLPIGARALELERPAGALPWHAHRRLEKWDLPVRDLAPADLDVLCKLSGQEQVRILRALGLTPKVEETEGNLLMYGGASLLIQYSLGNGTTTADQTLTYLNNTRAALGVGDSTTAAAATQNDLQAATNKLRVGMDATYPLHTDGTASGNASWSLRSTFSTAQANWAWQEWIVANSATAATGRALNRKVESLGTKTSAAAWTFTVTLTLA
jgi:hypothetical protein